MPVPGKMTKRPVWTTVAGKETLGKTPMTISGKAAWPLAVSLLLATCQTTGSSTAVGSTAGPEGQVVASLVYRSGPYDEMGIRLANGMQDYFDLINRRDGGVGGIRLSYEECETGFNTKKAMACYEKLKGKRPSIVIPASTGMVYQLIPKSARDQIPIVALGIGRTESGDGKVFSWAFNLPANYWDQASSLIAYLAERVGGFDALKGKSIVHLFHNSAYGKEPNRTLETLARRYRYDLTLVPVDHPGHKQKDQWRRIRDLDPDFIFVSGWGVMNVVVVQQAKKNEYPMDRVIGNWWSASDYDVRMAGPDAAGYIGASFHLPGGGLPVHRDIIEYVYGGDDSRARQNFLGTVYYNRGLLHAMIVVEAIRKAQERFGRTAQSGEQVRWGLEHLELMDARFEELGAKDFAAPFRLSCADHGGSAAILFQQWDGWRWKPVSGWLSPMNDLVRPRVETTAAAYAKANGITPRLCDE